MPNLSSFFTPINPRSTQITKKDVLISSNKLIDWIESQTNQYTLKYIKLTYAKIIKQIKVMTAEQENKSNSNSD